MKKGLAKAMLMSLVMSGCSVTSHCFANSIVINDATTEFNFAGSTYTSGINGRVVEIAGIKDKVISFANNNGVELSLSGDYATGISNSNEGKTVINGSEITFISTYINNTYIINSSNAGELIINNNLDFGRNNSVIENNGQSIIVNGVINGNVSCKGGGISINEVIGKVSGATYVKFASTAEGCDLVEMAEHAYGCNYVNFAVDADYCGIVGGAEYACNCEEIGTADYVAVDPGFSSEVEVVNKVIHNGGTLVVGDFGGDGGGLYIKNSGDLTINGDVDVELVDNIGTINFKGENIFINGVQSDESANEIGVGVIVGEAISNQGRIDLLENSDLHIHGDITHHENAVTNIRLRGNVNEDGVSENVSHLIGNINGSENGNFNLILEPAGVWAPDIEQTEVVRGVELNGGVISINNGVFPANDSANTPNPNKYIELTLDDFKSNGIFNEFKIIRDGRIELVSKGGIEVRADLKSNEGDKVVFHGTTPNVTIPLLIINKDNNNGVPITREDEYSVTVIQAPVDTKMNFDASIGFYETSGNYTKVYSPILDEVISSNGESKKWNFVGWEEAEDNRSGKQESQKEAIEHSILVEDVEPIFKRFNDLRTDPSEIGVWVRGETGETKIRNLSYDHNIMSGGYDWDYKNDAGVLFAGVGFTYSTNECDDKAIGDTKGYGFNAYGSWLGKKNNDYVDLVVKYGKLDKSYAGYDENNIFVAGDYDKDLFTIAAKYGRRIFKDDWYYEPSVGLTWGRVGSADFTDNHGTRIHADNSYSNIASLGIQVGKNIKGIEYYGKAEVMHDFDGKIHVSAPGRSVEDDMGGTWVKCAIGASRKIDENNSFYLEVERDFGNKVEKPYGVSLGYRFTW